MRDLLIGGMVAHQIIGAQTGLAERTLANTTAFIAE
jgi:hypothetical protein